LGTSAATRINLRVYARHQKIARITRKIIRFLHNILNINWVSRISNNGFLYFGPLMSMQERWLQIKWEEINFSAEMCSRIRVQSSKGKHSLIKDNVARDIYTTTRDVKALVTFVKTTIAKKGTLFGAKF
jgi:hypothetical protein